MIKIADAAGSNHWYTDRIADGARKPKVKSKPGAVAVHAGSQNFTGAVISHDRSPLHRIDAGRFAAAMSEDLPARMRLILDLFRVYRHYDALRPKVVGRLPDQGRIRNSRSINTDLVGACVQHAPDIINMAYTAAHGQRDKHFTGYRFHY